MIAYRAPTPEDLDAIAANMRAFDRLECRVLGAHEPREALEEGVAVSSWCFVALDGETPLCVFGVADDGLLSDEGAPWLLCAEGIERHARALLTGTKAYLERMRGEYKTLANYVHAHNRQAIRYLKWCGFRFGAPVEIKGEPFLPFAMGRA